MTRTQALDELRRIRDDTLWTTDPDYAAMTATIEALTPSSEAAFRAEAVAELEDCERALNELRPEAGSTADEARDAKRWAALHFVHPADIAVVIMGAGTGSELVAKLAERCDAFIGRAKAAYSSPPQEDR